MPKRTEFDHCSVFGSLDESFPKITSARPDYVPNAHPRTTLSVDPHHENRVKMLIWRVVCRGAGLVVKYRHPERQKETKQMFIIPMKTSIPRQERYNLGSPHARNVCFVKRCLNFSSFECT
jgi:hypothetical protein